MARSRLHLPLAGAMTAWLLSHAPAWCAETGQPLIADEDQTEPLRPRFETPSEGAERRKRAHFLRPSELGGASPASPASAGPSASPSPSSSTGAIPHAASLLYAPVRSGVFTGYWRDFTGTQSFGPPGRNDGRGVLQTRALYSYLGKGADEWSGVELSWDGTVFPRFATGVLYHHEYRREAGGLLVGRMAGSLTDHLQSWLSVGAGNGAHFLPITALDVEVGGRFSDRAQTYYGLGVGTSWWTLQRRHGYVSLRYVVWLGHQWGAESRTGFRLVGSGTAPARFAPMLSFAVVKGRAESIQWNARVVYSRAPQYVSGAPLESTPDRTVLDGAVGVRQWVTGEYGYSAEVQYGTQLHGYHRVGVEYSVFFHLW